MGAVGKNSGPNRYDISGLSVGTETQRAIQIPQRADHALVPAQHLNRK